MIIQPSFLSTYSPTHIDDFLTDSSILTTIKTLIFINDIHIIISGAQSSGKTTLLRLMVSEYYSGIPASQYQSNVLYINNLTEQGVQYFRSDVQLFCQTKSECVGKQKIIVLDDVDGMNDHNQHIFRNYIDKYGKNVKFFLSCTNNSNIIENLQSRLLDITITRPNSSQLCSVIERICDIENIAMANDDKHDIIHYLSQQSIKSILNRLEKYKILACPITIKIAMQTWCIIEISLFEEYTQHIVDKNIQSSIRIITSIYNDGFSIIDIFENYFLFIKWTTMLTDEQKYDFIKVLCHYMNIVNNIYENKIELYLFTANLIRGDMT